MAHTCSKSRVIQQAGRNTLGAVGLLALLFPVALEDLTRAQGSVHSSLVLTAREFQLGRDVSVPSSSTCINVWEDGRFHLEIRRQLTSGHQEDLLAYDSKLPENQLHTLKEILRSDDIKRLPAPTPEDRSVAKAWMQGMQAWITRDSTVQVAGYFEWGTHESAGGSGETVHIQQPDAKTALKPLEQWLHHIDSEHLSLGNAQPTMCNVAS